MAVRCAAEEGDLLMYVFGWLLEAAG